MTPAQSQQLGLLTMVASALQLLLFAVAMSRRSYLAIAIPVFAALAAGSALAFWVGYTMATADWDDDELEDDPATAEPPAPDPEPVTPV